MDFNKGAYEKASQVNSRTQLYKQAGNAIVVNCLIGIFGQMIEGHEDDYEVMALDAINRKDTTQQKEGCIAIVKSECNNRMH